MRSTSTQRRGLCHCFYSPCASCYVCASCKHHVEKENLPFALLVFVQRNQNSWLKHVFLDLRRMEKCLFKKLYINDITFGEGTEHIKLKRDVLLHLLRGTTFLYLSLMEGTNNVTTLYEAQQKIAALDVFSSLKIHADLAQPLRVCLSFRPLTVTAEAREASALPVNLTLSSFKEKNRAQLQLAANVGSSGESPEVNNSVKLLNVFGRMESLTIQQQGHQDQRHLFVSCD